MEAAKPEGRVQAAGKWKATWQPSGTCRAAWKAPLRALCASSSRPAVSAKGSKVPMKCTAPSRKLSVCGSVAVMVERATEDGDAFRLAEVAGDGRSVAHTVLTKQHSQRHRAVVLQKVFDDIDSWSISYITAADVGCLADYVASMVVVVVKVGWN